MDIPWSELLKIALSFVAGALLGLERESRSKPAGLRTIILITIGSTLFAMLSYSLRTDSPDRIASNIITGIGFVGAGVIFKEGLNLKGITTAATIWVAAAIGMAIGFGNYWLAAATLAVALITLTLLPNVEARLGACKLRKAYKITFDEHHVEVNQLEDLLHEKKIQFTKEKLVKHEGKVSGYYSVISSKANHEWFEAYLLKNERVKGLEVKLMLV